MKAMLLLGMLASISLAAVLPEDSPAVVPEGTCNAPPQNCTQPTWPTNFTASWNEQTNFTGTMKYSGGYTIYGWSNNPALWWHRWDSWADPYCNNALPAPYDTQCAHVVVGGKRYMYYPILNQCCFCCNNAQGCGVPAPTFMNGSPFLGTGMYYGLNVNYWKFNEFVYAETVDPVPTNRNWVGLWSQNDTYSYVWSFDRNADSITLPSICATAKNCPGNPCKARRSASPALPQIYFN